MIAYQFRFHGHTAMRFVFGRGQTVRGPLMALRYVSNPRRSDVRAAVVVSRKVHKSAVVRNRIRRRLYEQIRHQLPSKPFDLVVTVYSDKLAVLPAEELASGVDQLWRRAGLR